VTAARVLPAWLRGYERSWLRPDLDVQAADMLDDLARELGRTGVELRLATVRAPARPSSTAADLLHASAWPRPSTTRSRTSETCSALS
jgi:hypothetical protein